MSSKWTVALMVGGPVAVIAVVFLALKMIGGSSAPALDVRDLPMEFALDAEGDRPVFLPHCDGSTSIQRYAEPVSAQRFMTSDETRWVQFVVVEKTDDRLFPSLTDLIRNCKPESRVSTTPDAIVADSVAIEVATGPDLGDESLWFTTDVNTVVGGPSIPSDLLDDEDESPSPGVIVRTGDFVFQLRGYGVSSEDLAELAARAMD
ncbi:hypothetical protein [Pimelobacter simplex]|uniref:hypothetical protein n=1 Tax=Nocardioides simplex TaxID=2045 RepID=UPI00215035C4|nr:hypothetical protein [Pimelobacter simplex]UUW92236.1 hypothetical protein M0M43_12365 [Pimelobacter simplex]UUW96063.1 hypothetical protein M0M48_00995 [Pimelobacter simplex]